MIKLLQMQSDEQLSVSSKKKRIKFKIADGVRYKAGFAKET